MSRFSILAAATLALAVPGLGPNPGLGLDLGLGPAPAMAQAADSAKVAQFDHISIETIGSGPPVVMIPGLAMARESWRPAATRIAADHTVYLVQLNGFGGSDPGANLEAGLMDGAVADLHRFIRENGLAGAKLVGHSLGGTLALQLAQRHPRDVAGVLLVDALPWVGLLVAPATATPRQIEPLAAGTRDDLAARHGQAEDEGVARATMAKLALKPAGREQAYRWSRGADVRVVARAMYEDFMTDLRDGLPEMTVPLTLIYPWEAQGAAKQAADRLYRESYAQVPDMTFVDVGDSGHFIMFDQPEAFDRALDAFLAD